MANDEETPESGSAVGVVSSPYNTGERSRVLLVEDDSTFGGSLLSWLSRAGFHAALVVTGLDAMVGLLTDPPALALVDWNLAGEISGLDLCRECRKRGGTMAIIMISGPTYVGDRITALNAGADDYVTKPFDPAELLARMQAVLRRCEKRDGSAKQWGSLQWGPLVTYPMTGVCLVDGVECRPTPTQGRILARLIQADGELVTNDDIWRDYGVQQSPNLARIRTHVHGLRRLLGPRGSLIKTVPGQGYHLLRDVGQTTPRRLEKMTDR